MQKVEVNQRRIFVGIEQGVGKCKNDLLVIMNKDRTDIGSKWIRENYGESFKFVQEKYYESSMPMKSDENGKSVNDVEECMRNELKKEKRNI